MKIDADHQSESLQRAGRYPVRTPIRFRIHGQDEWHEGVTENISRTGVFLVSPFLLRAGAKVEMVLSLPSEVLGGNRAEMIGQGRVVRQRRSSSLDQPSGMATTIDRYRLARKAATPQESPSKS